MPGQREINTMDRIMNIRWQKPEKRGQPSHLALFHEYLRRTGLWCDALAWPESHPIASDFPARLVPDARATPVHTTLMQQTMRTLGHTSVYERMLMTHVLNWSAIADMQEVKQYQLPDLYEPILIFYERGGWFDKELGESEWNISGVTERLNRACHYYHEVELIPLDISVLDELDGAPQI